MRPFLMLVLCFLATNKSAGQNIPNKTPMNNAPIVSVMNKKEARSLIKQFNGKRDKELYEDEFFNAYVLSDGRLVVLGEHGVVYPSRQSFLDFLKSLRDRAALKPASHILEAFSGFSADFPTEVASHIQRLKMKSVVYGVELDDNINDLAKLDNLFEKGLLVSQEWFAEVVAVTGGVLSAGKGEWVMNYNHEFKIWEPNMVWAGKTYHPWLLVYQALAEDIVETGKSSLHERMIVLFKRK
jgi:hypothetical protein